MAYTIIEVEKLTGVPSRKLRFWCDKGLFPFIEKDKNGVRYFSQKDLEWVAWIDCYRTIGMSIAHFKEYIHLCSLGTETLEQRLDIIKTQKTTTIKEIKNLKKILSKLEYKIDYYNELIAAKKDSANPLSKDYRNIKDFKAKCTKIMPMASNKQ